MSAFNFPLATDHQPGGWHAAYMPVYDRLFERFKHCSGNLLEIGVAGGGALMSYANYFEKFHIYGMDIHDTAQEVKDHPRVTFYQQDGYAGLPTNIVGNTNFDVIIDDGPHSIDTQKLFTIFYPHLLTQQGIAIVEDIQHPDHIEVLAACVPKGFFSFAVDLRHVEPRRYDNLIMCIQRE